MSLAATGSKNIVTGSGYSRHCQTWLESRFSWNENLQLQQNHREIYKS